eukprot:6463946-Prorocentrum_lima.AAC.1
MVRDVAVVWLAMTGPGMMEQLTQDRMTRPRILAKLSLTSLQQPRLEDRSGSTPTRGQTAH